MAECNCGDCFGEHWGEPGLRIAVDIEGELAALSRAMCMLETARVMVDALSKLRELTEREEQGRHEHWVSDSPRARKLKRLAEQLSFDARELTRAMLASTTIDDEIPF